MSETCQASVTELEVIKIAAEHGIDPLYNTERLWFNSVPPLAMKHGDVGYYNKQELDKDIWVLYAEGNDADTDVSTILVYNVSVVTIFVYATT